MQKRYYTLLILIFAFSLKAQLGKEAWHWQFGKYCALDFSSGSPVVGTSAIITNEGCASISDPTTGQLLFYTDGVSVWNKNNTVMQNGYGLFGNTTTSQSALIVPKPGTINLFYVFTADYEGSPKGVRYTLVDMNLDNGNGDVIPSTKNTLLTFPPAAEKLTAIRHCNGIDFWVIDHPLNSNSFYAYLVSSMGVTASPVISNTGSFIGSSVNSGNGYLKGSPNGKRLAAGGEYIGKLDIFNFNNSTGQVNTPITITYPFILQGAYGVCFSPDNSKLYATDLYNKRLYQYDLSSNIPATVIASETVIDSNFVGYMGALQFAPDGKIYIVRNGFQTLSVINNPNALGLACNFQLNGIVFQSTQASSLGLPNFIEQGISPRKDTFDMSICSPAFPVTIVNDSAKSSILWSTGDTLPSISASSFGSFWVSYINSTGCKETDTFHIKQATPLVVNILKDSTVCANQLPININATLPNILSYSWNDSFNQPIRAISTQGLYWVDFTFNNFCVSRDSFNFSIDSVPSIKLGKDTALCKPYSLRANPGEQYDWSNGATTQQITVSISGIYSIIVTSPQGCKNSDTINVTIYSPPIIKVLKDSIQCGNLFIPVNENAFFPNTALYNWSDGSNQPTHLISSPGIYWLDYTLMNSCVTRDSFSLYLYSYPIVSLGNDTVFCQGQRQLSAYNPNCIYQWNTGEVTSSIIATSPSTYWVQVNNHGCLNFDTMIVNPDFNQLNFIMPNIVTPNNDNINDAIDFSKYGFSEIHLEIYSRWGNKISESTDINYIWKPIDVDGTYFYTLQYKINCGVETQVKVLKGFITVVR